MQFKTTLKDGVASAFLLVLVSAGVGCGTPGNPIAGAGGASAVSVTGTVEIPTSTSSNISVGSSLSSPSLSLSKGVAKASSDEETAPVAPRIVVLKAVSDIPATTGTATAKTTAGVTLGTGTVSLGGSIQGLIVNTSNSPIILEANVRGKSVTSLCDLSDAASGTTFNCGTVNTNSTLSVEQIYYQADSSCSSATASACASKLPSNLLGLFQIFQNVYGVSSSAGSSDAGSGYLAMSKALRAAMAEGVATGPADIVKCLRDASVCEQWKAFDSNLVGIDMSAALTHIQSYIPAVTNTIQDATTYSKYAQAGSAGWSAMASYFGKQDGTALASAAAKPTLQQSFLNQYGTDYLNGNTSAFDVIKKKGAAQVMGQFIGKASTSDTLDFEALKKLIDAASASFDTLSAGQYAAVGEAYYTRLKSATDAATLASIKNNPSTFATPIFANPTAYTGAGGTTAWTNSDTFFIQDPSGFQSADFRPCQSDAECASAGKICGGLNNCVASSCSSSCGMGAVCAANSNCITGYCSSGFCGFPSGVNPLQGLLKAPGSACSANNECASFNCLNGSCQNFGDCVWASAGKIVFYSKTALSGLPDGTPTSSNNVWIMNADGTGKKALTENSNASLDSSHIGFSPDGTKVAFSSKTALNGGWDGAATGSSNIWTMNINGTGGTYLTENTNASLDSSQPVFSPDGTKFVFHSKMALNGTTNGAATSSNNIWIMNIDGTGKTALTQNANASLDSQSPSFSPDGTKITFQSKTALNDPPNDPEWNGTATGSFNIWTMNIDGTGGTPLTRNSGASSWSSAIPTFSPDGTKITFYSQTALDESWGGTGTSSLNVWIMNIDGTGRTALTRNSGASSWHSFSPFFSPDGTKITFYSKTALDGSWNGTATGSYNVWTMNINGTGGTYLTENTNASLDSTIPSFSPDGTKIVFYSKTALDTGWNGTATGSTNVWTMNAADGTGRTPLTENTANSLDSVVLGKSKGYTWHQQQLCP